MLPRERLAYSAIVDRPKLVLPGGARVVVWTIVNLEVWDIARPMARQVLSPPTGQSLLPDLPNWSWHEYGMRVGVWRFFKLFERLGIRPTLSINARVCLDYERVAAQARAAGWEFMGHAYEQMPIHKVEDQRAMIHQSLDVLERFAGRRPVGWLGPGLTETYETPDLLAEAGVRYIGDWVHDDEPTEIRTAHGPLVTLPYTVELNDIPTMAVQYHEFPCTGCANARTCSTATISRAPSGRRLWRSPSTPTSRGSRIASAISKRYTTTSTAIAMCCTGMVRRSWNGTGPRLLAGEPPLRRPGLSSTSSEWQMRLPTHGRYDYTPLPSRPVYEWPNGTRLAFALCNNIEHFAFRAGLGSDTTAANAAQTQRNYAWRDYGNRVGIWHYFDLLDEFGLPGSHNVNSAALDACPEIALRINRRGDEYIGHGRTNAERQDALWEEDEARLIAESTAAIAKHAGKPPRGWMGPYFAQSRLHPRSSQGGGLRLCPGLARRRPALLDAHARRADPLCPLLRGGERQPRAGVPSPDRARLRGDDHRPLR